jgi:hypothetical protein
VSATIDPSALSPEPEAMRIGLLERNRSVLARAARVMRAAANLDWVAADEDPLVVRAQLAADAQLVACEGADAAIALDWMGAACPRCKLVAWSHDPAPLLALAERDDRLVSLIGWPSFQSMPRAWEIALATRTVLAPGPESTMLGDVFAGAPVVAERFPSSQADRDGVVGEIGDLVERVGAADRVSARIAGVAHELVMNATYDAPVGADGEPRYAHDRRAPVTLDRGELPLVRFATDGQLVALQVSDRFGRLTRDQVLASILRGAGAGSANAADVVDPSYGGAGLGLWRVYSLAAVTIVDIIPGHTTCVTAVFDVDVGAREARNLPPSLHLFDRGRMG